MLEAINISKEFPGVKALKNVNFRFFPAKVNAIVGENGAGKSTLLKILTGVYSEYEGEIRLNDKKISFRNVREAQNSGIAMIHQELNLIPELSIQENIFLGREKVDVWGLLDNKSMFTQTKDLLSELHLNYSPEKKIKELRVGEQQLVEIAKALLTDANIILMDEPTSALTDKEIEHLHVIIRQLKIKGKTIVYISHKMDELFRIADFYTVLRDGESVDSGSMKAVDEKTLIQKMVGREVLITKNTFTPNLNEVVLELNQVSVVHPHLKNRKLLENISFQLRKGEILGVFGLMGAGRTELLQTIFGVCNIECGKIMIDGIEQQIDSPNTAMKCGLAFVTEDRKEEGLILNQSIAANISLPLLESVFLLDEARESKIAQNAIDSLKIKTNSPHQICQNLSGGNQQKVVIAKCLETNPKILMLDEPTRGIDIQAKSEIYSLIKQLAQTGLAILVVSSEIPELLALTDRILVMSGGKITNNLTIDEANEELLLKYAI